jgi:hypothetical protein
MEANLKKQIEPYLHLQYQLISANNPLNVGTATATHNEEAL